VVTLACFPSVWPQGVSEGEIMKLCGWKTRAMFDRYNVIDEADLAEAVAKRFGAKQWQTKGKQWQTLTLPPHHRAR